MYYVTCISISQWGNWMKRKCLVVGIILLFVGTVTIPAIAQDVEKTEYVGKIYGYTQCSRGGWAWDPIPHAIVRIGLKITRSDSYGYYEITGLPINRTYIVVANHLGYVRTVGKVILTAEKPEKKLDIEMESVFGFILDILEQIIKFLPQGVNVHKI